MSAPAAVTPTTSPAALLARSLLSSGRSPAKVLRVAPLPPAVVEALCARGDGWLRERAVVSWEQPAKGHAAYGFGEAWRLRGERGEGPEAVAAAVRQVTGASRATKRDGGPRLRIFGGMCFDPAQPNRDARWQAFGDWQFVAPRLLLLRDGDAWSGTLTWKLDGSEDEPGLARAVDRELDAVVTAGDQPGGRRGDAPGTWPPEGVWKQAVAEAVREIRGGDWRKLVLARSVTVTMPGRVSHGPLLTRLAARYAGCYIFKFAAGDDAWLGATPELLVSLRARTVSAACLAGSRPRNIDPVVDARLSADLLGSAKERSEHAFVVDMMRDSLGPLCDGLSAPATPEIMRMANIQHLYTPVAGPVADGVDIFDLVAAVHPTPAVGGWPREGSREAIRRLEGMDRGWYAAPIGWVDDAGEGEFAVALRSALVRGECATLYAGAGIVAGSDPAEELAETELKLRPLWEALKES
ncbi:MAG: isochorismate synthase [Chloroflexi bacterium]|nr:isochorismate synthase [Chloroflexota bacterium]